MPQFSVIIPTYNRAQFLDKAIQSVLAQTYRDYELIVCDDGSTDDTAQVLARYPGLTVVHSPRLGPGGARNAALAVATGEYISCLDSDDLWMSHTLEMVNAVLTWHQGDGGAFVFLTAGDLANHGEEGMAARAHRVGVASEATESALDVSWYEDIAAAHACGVRLGSGLLGAAPADALRRAGGFAKGVIIAEDVDLALRASVEVPVAVIERPATVLCRAHPGQITRSPQAMYSGGEMLLTQLRQGAYQGHTGRQAQVREIIARHVGAATFSLARRGEYTLSWRLYRQLVADGLVAPRITTTWATPLAWLLRPLGVLHLAEALFRRIQVRHGFWSPTPRTVHRSAPRQHTSHHLPPCTRGK